MNLDLAPLASALPSLNAAIALSILFLGPEIVRTRRRETSFTICAGVLNHRRPPRGLLCYKTPALKAPALRLLDYIAGHPRRSLLAQRVGGT